MVIPLLDTCDVAGEDITTGALLTQRALASYLVARDAHYYFTVKGNQPTLQADVALLFAHRGAPDFVTVSAAEHGRIETRRIWCSTALNDHVDFPQVGQVSLIERQTIDKKTGKQRGEIALGVASRTPEQTSPQRVLAVNRGDWASERAHYLLDWNYDEDRSRISVGFGPQNISRLRQFAIGILKAFQKSGQSIAEMMGKLCFRTTSGLRLSAHDREFSPKSPGTGGVEQIRRVVSGMKTVPGGDQRDWAPESRNGCHLRQAGRSVATRLQPHSPSPLGVVR